MKFWGHIASGWRNIEKRLKSHRPHYRRILYVDSLSGVTDLKADQVAIVKDGDVVKWAVLRCPCGCSELIYANLMKSHTPHWELKIERNSNVTLHPSLWKDAGCRSHFILRGGKVFWC